MSSLARAAIRPRSGMSKRILVVEDQPDNRQIIRDMLAPTDCFHLPLNDHRERSDARIHDAKGSLSAPCANRSPIFAKRSRTDQDRTAPCPLAPNLAHDIVREHTGNSLFHATSVDNGRFLLPYTSPWSWRKTPGLSGTLVCPVILGNHR
jgi:CheY-like chemotaxis protein